MNDTYRAHFKKNLTLATPIMLGQMGQLLVNFVDNVMVGQLGATSLAAVSLSIAIYISFFVAGMGLSFALPPLIAEADGNQNRRSVSQYFKHSLVINVIYAMGCVVAIETLIPLLSRLGQDPDVVAQAIPYLRISAWTTIPYMIFQTLRCYTDGLSWTKPAMIAILIGNVINVAVNYIFIFGKMGAPALGVAGAAIGTLVSRVVMIVIIFFIIYKSEALWRDIRNARMKIYQLKLFRRVLSIGIPTGLQLFFEVSAFGGASILMGMISAQAQAAHQIAINLASITFLICTGLGMAATIRVGNQKGEANATGVRMAGLSALVQSVIFMSIGAICFVLFRWQLPLMYIDDPQVIEIAASLLLLAALFQLSDGIQVVALGALRGLQDVRAPMIITFIAYWVIGFPTSYLTAFYLDWGPSGVWVGLVVGLTVSAVMLTLRFHRKTQFT